MTIEFLERTVFGNKPSRDVAILSWLGLVLVGFCQ